MEVRKRTSTHKGTSLNYCEGQVKGHTKNMAQQRDSYPKNSRTCEHIQPKGDSSSNSTSSITNRIKKRKWTAQENLRFNTFNLFNFPYLFEKRINMEIFVDQIEEFIFQSNPKNQMMSTAKKSDLKFTIAFNNSDNFVSTKSESRLKMEEKFPKISRKKEVITKPREESRGTEKHPQINQDNIDSQ